MGIFKGENNSEYVTKLGGSVDHDAAIKVLQDHEFVIKLDPHFLSCETRDGPNGEVTMTEEVLDRKCGETRFYEVKDKVPERYAKLLPGKPTSTSYYQVTNLRDGIFMYIQAALGIAVSREIVVREGPSGTEIVQRVTAAGAKMLLGTVREQGEETWRDMHTSMAQRMGGVVASHG